jgi:hypothetical protein
MPEEPAFAVHVSEPEPGIELVALNGDLDFASAVRRRRPWPH